MKTSAASLLITIAGFLQESKCMEFFSAFEPITGTAVLTLGNQDFTGNLKASENPPGWLLREPSEPFEYYEVYFRGCTKGRHAAVLRGAPRTPGHQLNGVEVRMDNVEFGNYEHEFRRYLYGSYLNLMNDRQTPNIPDHAYITIPETKKVFYVPLETREAHRERIQREELERQMA